MDRSSIWKLFAWFVSRTGFSRFVSRFSDVFQLNKDSQSRAIFPFIKRRRNRNCQILAYHRVNDDQDMFFPGIPIKCFEQQMSFLADHFTVCSLKELVQRIRDDDLPENAIAVTFDDGYRDNYLNAFPILQRFSIPATIFLATGAIGSGPVLWHDRVFAAFRKTDASFLDGFSSHIGKISLGSQPDRTKAQRRVLEFLWSKDDQERELAIDRLTDCLDVTPAREIDGLMMSWEEVSEMHRQGIEVGAHTVTHPILSRLPQEKVAREIIDSMRTIEERLRTQVTSFAYPVGRSMDFNPTTKALLKQAGYRCALTMIFGSNGVGVDPYELRRVIPWNEEATKFGLRLSYYKFSS